MEKLAIFGGQKVIEKQFARYNHIGDDEIDAAVAVLRTGTLSNFIGAPGPQFLGGPKVQEFELELARKFAVKHAITVNSWTSGLISALGALDIQPGDEVITTPWTMSATATAIVHWNGIPVFADIDPHSYNLTADSISRCITEKTVAIIVVDIFGQSADMDSILSLARQQGLKVISDSAQAPGALYKDKFAGTLADIGGYSFNYHKHIHTGEGGVLFTNSDKYARKLRLLRNHAEVCLEDGDELGNMVGYNFRLGEIEAAIGIEQLKKLPSLVASRQSLAKKLTLGLSGLRHLKTPVTMPNNSHSFYIYALQFECDEAGVSRDEICNALEGEGLTLFKRYQNIHLLPMYQKKLAYGSSGVPWSLPQSRKDISYQKGICPVAEALQDKYFFGIGLCMFDYSADDIDLIVDAFRKVWRHFGLD